jgi:gluconolactonase
VSPRALVAAFALILAAGLGVRGAAAQLVDGGPLGRPAAIVDLGTESGLRLVGGQWRYHDVTIVEVGHRAVGADLRPSGPPNRTLDIAPHAGAADFDDSGWAVLPAATLQARKGHGRLSFAWYRTRLTVPDRVGALDPTGATLVFEIVVDDYAEVWVNGVLPVVLGQTGGPLVRGFNAPNRVVLTHDARPGQQFQLAVFGANGPLSNPPGNFVWVRSATLEFHRPDSARRVTPVATRIVRHDPALDDVVPPSAQLEKLAGGFLFTEGPVWIPRTETTPGHLLFSDPDANTIYRWSPDGQVAVFRVKSGYAGLDVGEYRQPGSNGLTLDREGRLTIAEHGNRRVTRLARTGALTVLADRHDGRRLNSPNDVVYRSDGALFFTDPPFGLPRAGADPRRELPHAGIYAVIDGTLRLLSTDLAGPNGLAFSPDERHLYVGNWDPARKVVMRYEVHPDGRLTSGRVFFDMTAAPGDDAVDGIKVDQRGNVYVSGPGGLWILSPEGRHLGTLVGPEHAHNMAWGDDDGRTLYLAAQTGIYRIRLAVGGAGIRH